MSLGRKRQRTKRTHRNADERFRLHCVQARDILTAYASRKETFLQANVALDARR